MILLPLKCVGREIWGLGRALEGLELLGKLPRFARTSKICQNYNLGLWSKVGQLIIFFDFGSQCPRWDYGLLIGIMDFMIGTLALKIIIIISFEAAHVFLSRSLWK